MVEAYYYDGRTARRHRVTLAVQGDVAEITGEGVHRRECLADLRVSEAMGLAPRLITFPDGAHCEVRDHATLEGILEATGARPTRVSRMQRDGRWIAAAVLLCAVLAVVGFRHALPAAARTAADLLPAGVMDDLGARTLMALDGQGLTPSRLPRARQDRLALRFRNLAMPGGEPLSTRLEFRHGGPLGANALALPGHIIVVTDELIELAADDDQVMAALAHEAGHVRNRHALRLILQGSATGVILAWYFGDTSVLLATAPAVLAGAQYSRDLEREADAFAAQVLRLNGLSPGVLADMLERLAAARPNAAGPPGILAYLASHPSTPERLRTLRGD